MAKRLFVGGLSFETTSSELRKAFEEVGPVASADVVIDRETGRSRGFGFVEMQNEADTPTAISQLNGRSLGGRALTVNEAAARSERGGGGFRGGRSGGGGHSGGRGRGGNETGPRATNRTTGSGGYGGSGCWR